MVTHWVSISADYATDAKYQRADLFALVCQRFDAWQAEHPHAVLLNLTQHYSSIDVVSSWAAFFIVYDEG